MCKIEEAGRQDLINLVLVSLVEVSVKVSLLVEGLAAKRTCPLRSTVSQLGRVLWREDVPRRVKRTLQGEFHLEIIQHTVLYWPCVLLPYTKKLDIHFLIGALKNFYFAILVMFLEQISHSSLTVKCDSDRVHNDGRLGNYRSAVSNPVIIILHVIIIIL